MTCSAEERGPGIYGIYCTANGKWYVGQAQNLRRRIQEEQRHLNRGDFHNDHLQNAWNKYGPQCFDWVTLFVCPVQELDEWERVWIARLHSFTDGFNKTVGGCGARGYKQSPEARKRLSEINRDGKSPRKGRPISAEAKARMRANALGGKSPKARAVLQLTRERVILRRFDSVADAERLTGINGAHISEVCRSQPKRKSAGGYLWRWEAEYEHK